MYSQYAKSQSANTIPPLANTNDYSKSSLRQSNPLYSSYGIPTPFDDMGPLQADVDYCITSLQAYVRKYLARKHGILVLL